MATIFVDLENGNDSNDGYSFANRKKTLASAVENSTLTAGDTVRIMGSPAPTLVGNGDVVDRNSNFLRDYTRASSTFSFSTTEGETVLTLNNHHLSTGDTIGFAGSISEINGHWEITKVDDNSFKIDGFTASSTSLSGTSYVYDKTASRIKLASAVTQNIASFGPRTTAWTASANVTTSLKTSTNGNYQRDGEYMEHSSSDEIVVSSSFGTGKAAYFATGALDLSSYQQISFFVSQPSGTKVTPSDPILPTSTGNYSLRLCTDNQGDTTVHTINFNVYKGASKHFRPITVDLGTNLNSSIQSIALYIDTDEGAQTIQLNNIIACKASSSADSLTLSSLVGLNTTDDPIWYPIQSINGTRVLLDTGRGFSTSYEYTPLQDDYSYQSAYWSSSGTKSIYKRETIKTPLLASTTTRLVDNDNLYPNANSSNRVTFSGGWNRTDMSTQTLESYIDGTNRYGYGFFNDESYCTFEKITWIRFLYGIYNAKDYIIYDNVGTIFCTYANLGYYENSVIGLNNLIFNNVYRVELVSTDATLNKLWMININQVYIYGSSKFTCTDFNIYCNDSTSSPYLPLLGDTTITNLNIKNTNKDLAPNSSTLISKYTISNLNLKNNNIELEFKGTATEDSAIIENINDTSTQSLATYTTLGESQIVNNENHLKILGGTIKSSLSVKTGTTTKLNSINFDFTGNEITASSISGVAIVTSRDHDDVSGDYKTFIFNGESNVTSTLTKESSIRNTASGVSWKWERLQTDRHDEDNPYVLNLGKVAVGASTQCTFKLHVRRSHTVGFAKLKVSKNTLIGMSSDVTAVSTGNADTWEEISLNFTPTSAGFVSVEVEFYATDTTGSVIIYIDDFEATQV